MVTVHVDMQLLLATMSSSHTRAGEWVNVISYVTAVCSAPQRNQSSPTIFVQAILLWSAGSFNLHAYERSLDQQNADRNLKIDVDSDAD